MAIVQTVLGPVDTADLGPTLVHEHVYLTFPGAHLDPADDFDKSRCIETAVERLQQTAGHGIKTWVDPCPIDLGRDPELLAEVSRRSGVQIVCTTGFYHEEIGVPHYWRLRSVGEIHEFYMHEITNGIGATGIKPGAIKIATGDPVTELEKKVVRAAGRAAKDSGLTVISHCENSTGWDAQQDVLADEGVDLGRCLIGHQDQADEVGQLVKIAERGSFAGVDRVGYEVLASEDDRVGLVKGMLDAGHQDRLCLSQDHMCCMRAVKFPFAIPEGMEEMAVQLEPWVREQMYGRPHDYLFTDFWPKLEAAGVARATFDSILVDNPRKLFGG
jgi:phosphotriesterase-related protein